MTLFNQFYCFHYSDKKNMTEEANLFSLYLYDFDSSLLLNRTPKSSKYVVVVVVFVFVVVVKF